MRSYDDLVSEALAADFRGWDFGFLAGRIEGGEAWNYDDLASAEITDSTRLLDIGTGGGETLEGILAGRRPAHVVATEGWAPNVPVARERLEPFGIEVRQSVEGEPLPAADGEFDLVLARHAGASAAELSRVLQPGGVFLTQGVGRDNDLEFNEVLDGPPPTHANDPSFADSVAGLKQAGFAIDRAEETFNETGYLDIGAIVFHLMAVSWQVPGFDVTTYDQALRTLDARIRVEGRFVVRNHRTLIRARRV
ncbi:class I SAM-dependent methyltransferase [Tenggerimyces flavus]|uniref:Class I SAM-dependent methyltransferase n=1 Tax=Tenggerimyces flavus TaxID=1708749 RepID=A0ABV7Y554_9ACTN|nr:methyltransferase domain-containing protein [Tenggerimyces flavus]MBM7788266.1 SAM-dependent methyltransferase [Tenggerimyces flavus]